MPAILFSHKQKNRRQHQADKGGLPVIKSTEEVRIPSLIPSQKQHNYSISILLLSPQVNEENPETFEV
jgi:hypothetical protein